MEPDRHRHGGPVHVRLGALLADRPAAAEQPQSAKAEKSKKQISDLDKLAADHEGKAKTHEDAAKLTKEQQDQGIMFADMGLNLAYSTIRIMRKQARGLLDFTRRLVAKYGPSRNYLNTNYPSLPIYNSRPGVFGAGAGFHL